MSAKMALQCKHDWHVSGRPSPGDTVIALCIACNIAREALVISGGRLVVPEERVEGESK